jgi:hypothetical protein
MFENVNRDVLIIFPKQPLIDWANRLNPNEDEECPMLMDLDQANVYMIPEFEDPKEALDFVKQNLNHFFENELKEWYTDENKWPEKRTWDIFEQWFHYSIQSVVVDIVNDGIKKYRY